MSTIYIFIAAIFGTGIVIWLVYYMFSLFDLGLFDYIQNGFHWFTELFGSTLSYTFLGMFGVAFLVLVVRFIMSWIGENPGHSANR